LQIDLKQDNFKLNNKELNSNKYQFMLYNVFNELVKNNNLDCAKNIIKYIDFKDKYDKKINLHVIEQLVSNSYDKLLFELIRVYPSNPLYFSKLTQINLANSVYSYCVKNNKVSQIFQIINGFKVDEIKKYLFNNK